MATTPSETTSNTWDCCIEKIFYKNGIQASRFECTICSKSVSRKSDFPRHMRQHTCEGLIPCLERDCEHPGFTQFGNMMTHHRAIHKKVRHRCPELVIDKNGREEQCPCDYSDPSGLIRHRKDKHGWESEQSKAKAKEPAIKREADDDDDFLASISAPSPKRAKPTPAPSPSRRSPKKPTSRRSAPVQVQQVDRSSLSTIPTAGPSQAYSQSQPGAGMTLTDPLSLPPSALLGNFGGPFSPEPQTAAVNKWVFPPITAFSFNFVAEPLPLPLPLPAINGHGDGTIDPSMLMIPASTVSLKMEQASLTDAGLASPPEFYHPRCGNDSPDSSRESSASPDARMFDSMPQRLLFPSEPLFNGYYGL